MYVCVYAHPDVKIYISQAAHITVCVCVCAVLVVGLEGCIIIKYNYLITKSINSCLQIYVL